MKSTRCERCNRWSKKPSYRRHCLGCVKILAKEPPDPTPYKEQQRAKERKCPPVYHGPWNAEAMER